MGMESNGMVGVDVERLRRRRAKVDVKGSGV